MVTWFVIASAMKQSHLKLLKSLSVRRDLFSLYVILAFVLAASRIGPESFFFQKDSRSASGGGMTIMEITYALVSNSTE